MLCAIKIEGRNRGGERTAPVATAVQKLKSRRREKEIPVNEYGVAYMARCMYE